jgi:hypothetical protein
MQEVVSLLRRSGGSELDDMDVPGIERLDEPADRAALAGGIPALEQDAQRRAKAGVAEQARGLQAQFDETALNDSEPRRLGAPAETLRQINLVETAHR